MIGRDGRVGVAPGLRPFKDLPEEMVGIVIHELAPARPDIHGGFRLGEHQCLFLRRHGDVTAGHDPVRGALVHGEVAGHFRSFGDDLDRARGRADDGDPLAFQCHRMIPARRVHLRAAERLNSFNGGPVRAVELAQRADENIAGESLAALRLDRPGFRVFVPVRADGFIAEMQMRGELVAFGDLLGIGLDFGALREGAGPVYALREGKLVERHRHIAGASGIGVFIPGAADLRIAVDEVEAVTVFLQLDCGGQAAEACPDDDGMSLRQASLPDCVSGRIRCLTSQCKPDDG